VVSAGGRLCPACREALATGLARLPGLYETCGRRLDGPSPDTTRPRVSGGARPVMPVNTAAMEARAAILAVLGSWAGAVADERRIGAPSREAARLAGFLGRHLDWLAAHPAAGDFSAEVARLVRRASRVVDPEVRRHVPIGSCVEDGCAGSLTAVVRADRPGSPTTIACDHDPEHRWPGHEWLRLGRLLDDAGPAAPGSGAEPVCWMTAADIGRLWSMPVGSVYRHASESGWRRRVSSGRTRYHGDDVTRSLSGRGAAAR
jgi:hypothetical protein